MDSNGGKTLALDHCDKNEDTDRAAETGSRAALCTGHSPAASEGSQPDTARILISQCAQEKCLVLTALNP